MGSDLTFEVHEFFQDKQMRFEAALAFATTKNWWKGEFTILPVDEAVKRADELIERLDETAK